jgi:hypothetical protein
MPVTLNCPRCDAVVEADDEDDLIDKVQAHVRDAHPEIKHELPAKHIRATFRRLTRE